MITTTRRRLAATATALTLAAALTACSDAAEPAAEPPAAAATSSAPEATGATGATGATEASEHNDADTQFAQMMVVHHQGAIEMAERAVDKADSEEVRALAERISAAQGPEIDEMNSWLQAWGEEGPQDADMGGMDHGGMDMGGMDMQSAMTELEGLSGAEFDRAFLEMMTEHHRGAIEMAEAQLADGANAEARDLARKMIDDQTREITEMENLLRNL
ncbi:DUF305 domain-containing protein [Cellulomonas sp. ATA003]|uniref:DUF305 domain-containing protein n=1 Tax=Cellulomonas sp. ATA003 TaxID=3073064 RepID=UPI002873688D|nr:DUF305 domain-containing protein [Cellulomonas sp. ATA003]WNB84708.1 DUF305 domain-containing protein [Cellulomonas sp. ATA003]